MSRPPKLWAYAGFWLDPYHSAPLVLWALVPVFYLGGLWLWAWGPS